MATLNANYIKENLKDDYLLPIEGVCKHEVRLRRPQRQVHRRNDPQRRKASARLRFPRPDHLLPAPFPRVHDDRAYRDRKHRDARRVHRSAHKVAKEARENPDAVKDAPLTTSVRHLDETGAAKNPILTYKSLKAQQ